MMRVLCGSQTRLGSLGPSYQEPCPNLWYDKDTLATIAIKLLLP